MQTKNAARAYPRWAQRVSGGDSTDFVRCRICGKHLRVISGRHLSAHGSDRETYIEEYGLSPDELCSKSFRINHSSRTDYRAHNKREWVIAIKKIHKQHGQVFAGYL
jgi:ROS/MUCR transcriptional regulator protein